MLPVSVLESLAEGEICEVDIYSLEAAPSYHPDRALRRNLLAKLNIFELKEVVSVSQGMYLFKLSD